MEHASKTEGPQTQVASNAPGLKPATRTDHSLGGDRLRGLARLINASPVVQQLQSVSDSIQCQGIEEEEQVQMNGGVPTQANRTGLPDNLKSGIESLSGLSMDHVRVHRNSSKPAQLNAHAFAQGADIHLAPGQDRHLPHEAWHVVQQAQGRVKPTMQMKGGVAINNDIGLEREADVMGARAVLVTDRGSGELPVQKKSLGQRSAPLQADKPASPSTLVAQLYGDPNYQPNLAGLQVPGGGNGQYNPLTFARPAGWYDQTLDSLFARLPQDDVQQIPHLNLTLVRCAVARTWHNINDMQIGHIQNWQQYVADTQPATIREATNAYNDLNNLRLESPTANASHDFEGGRDSEGEDESDDDDSFIDRSDKSIMSSEARQGLNEYKAQQSSTYRK